MSFGQNLQCLRNMRNKMTQDESVRGDFPMGDSSYSDIRMENVKAFDYIKYAVISKAPETDALNHVKRWAEVLALPEPKIIGWDFSCVSQEQINVLHMHGYEAALVVNEKEAGTLPEQPEVFHQDARSYIAITIREPHADPFRLIPNAYKVLLMHMKINGLKHRQGKDFISCFEKEYVKDGISYMDVYMAAE